MSESIVNKSRRKAHVNKKECVACGSCVPHCPKGALRMDRGLYAHAEGEHCVGCAKCIAICPASVIVMNEVAL